MLKMKSKQSLQYSNTLETTANFYGSAIAANLVSKTVTKLNKGFFCLNVEEL